jgi:hypothetical protein
LHQQHVQQHANEDDFYAEEEGKEEGLDSDALHGGGVAGFLLQCENHVVRSV